MNAVLSELLGTKRKPLMGEVRVRVRLTNAVDEALARRGALQPDRVRTYETEAVVNIGAVRSAVPIQVMQQLGLESVGKRRTPFANDLVEDLDVTEPVGIEIDGRRTTEDTG